MKMKGPCGFEKFLNFKIDFCRLKIQFVKLEFFQIDFSKTKDRWIGRKCSNHSLTDVKELHFIHTKRLFHAIQQNSLLTLIGMSSENKKNAPRSKFYNTQ